MLDISESFGMAMGVLVGFQHPSPQRSSRKISLTPLLKCLWGFLPSKTKGDWDHRESGGAFAQMPAGF